MRRLLVLIVLGLAASATVSALGAAGAAGRTVRVRISGGHATKPVDKGRPVVLVAAALGVPEEVFRDAFSRVSPAPAGSEPDPEQVNRNKAALLRTLAPYGVTNEELDRVSNHYRYNGSAGETWPHRAAVVEATVVDGRVTRVRVVRGGSGYTSTPRLTVPGVAGAKLRARLAFSRAFARNGRIDRVAVSGS